MNNKNHNYFETQSLPLAVSIICHNIPLDSLKKDPDGKCTFYFIQTPELTEIVQLYWQRALKIEPILFWETARFVKSRIYER